MEMERELRWEEKFDSLFVEEEVLPVFYRMTRGSVPDALNVYFESYPDGSTFKFNRLRFHLSVGVVVSNRILARIQWGP